MKVQCPNCGETIAVHGLGRKSGKYNVQNVLDTYHLYGSIRPAARKLDMPPGTVWHILKDNGALKGNNDVL